jgi:hypothetical protein
LTIDCVGKEYKHMCDRFHNALMLLLDTSIYFLVV